MVTCESATLSCRTILYLMLAAAFALNIMIRGTMNIAIIDMMKPKHSNDTNSTVKSIYALKNNNTVNLTRFDWSEVQKNQILGSFYWGYVVFEFSGGYVVDSIGPKKALGFGILMKAILTFITPLVARVHFIVLLLDRILMGVVSSGIFPSIMQLGSKWLPPQKRSRFMAIIVSGSIGLVISMPIYGWIISNYGWETVFFISGALGILFSALWFLLIFDTPDKHPRISKSEKAYITALLQTGKKEGMVKPAQTPWKAMLTSGPVWAVVLGDTLYSWSALFLLTHMPQFINAIHRVTIQKNGLYLSLIQLGRVPLALSAGLIADRLLKHQVFRLLTIRKIFATVTLLFSAVLFGAQGIYGENLTASIAIFALILVCNGAAPASTTSNVVDIAPSYCGTLKGIANGFGTALTLFSTEMVGRITNKSNTFREWRYPFFIIAAAHLIGYIIFMCFSSDKVQPWNYVLDSEVGQPLTENVENLENLKKRNHEASN